MAEQSPLDQFKAVLAGAARAIAREPEIELAFTADAPAASGKHIKVPMPARNLPADQVAEARGFADSFALRLRHHDAVMHARGAPGDAVARAVFDAAEQARILDPASPVFCRLAEADGAVVGFAVCLLHEGSWALTPHCYLEDLFVDPECRGRGAGRALIEDIRALAKARGWNRLYWHTREDNPARHLYDGFAPASGMIVYKLTP